MPSETRDLTPQPDPPPNRTPGPANPPGYDLGAEIGRGGMGAVYRARDTALDREVAVKLLQDRYAPGSRAAVRFLEEARITGQLQHPGIPAVYQVGTTPAGRPFLAMKLIKGDTLEDLLKRGQPVDALAVTEAVGQALGYAHSRRVIHRDLKPANIMVGAFGEVQVMDWGLAKVLGTASRPESAVADADAGTATEIRTPRDSDRDDTQAGSVLGTPAFMPPEQASGDLESVDTRSDVFGLGAILCVLLTGHPPFEGATAESTRAAAARGNTKAALARLDNCGADPDAVALCKRCLAVEPADRPSDAAVVATEIAHLRSAADERARKAELDAAEVTVRAAERAKRRRVVAAVVALGVAGIAAGLVRAEYARRAAEIALAGEAKQRAAAVEAREVADVARANADAARANADAKRAEAEVARQAEAAQRSAAETAQRAEIAQTLAAQASAAESKATVQFFEDRVLAAARPKGQDGGLGKDATLRDAINASLPSLEKDFATQPLVEARLRMTLGNTFRYLGDAKQSIRQDERARALFTQHYGPDHHDTLRSMVNLANSYADAGRLAEGLALREQTLEIMKRTLGADHPDTLKSMGNLAFNYFSVGRVAEALAIQEQTLAAQKRVLGVGHPDTLSSMTNLAISYSNVGRRREALALKERVLSAEKRVLGADHPTTLKSMMNLSSSYSDAGRRAEALALREQALASLKHVLGADHPDTLRSMAILADSYSTVGRAKEALALQEQVLTARRRVLGEDSPDTLSTMGNLANSYSDAGRADEALALRERVLEASKRVLGADSPETLMSMYNLANSYSAAGRRDEALTLGEQALAGRRRVFSADHPDTLAAQTNLAVAYPKLQRAQEALPLLEDSFRRKLRVLPADHQFLFIAALQLGRCHSALGHDTEAAATANIYLQHVEIRRVNFAWIGQISADLKQYLAKTKGTLVCRVTSEMYEKLDLNSANGHYNAAHFRAVAGNAAQANGDTTNAKLDADRAMTHLVKAVAAGYRNAAEMAKDDDLAILRTRPDFRRLLERITPELAPPPRAVAP